MNCKHEKLKWFERNNKVVCLECGESWGGNDIPFYPPTIPYSPPCPQPNYPIYPVVSWCKIDNSTIG